MIKSSLWVRPRILLFIFLTAYFLFAILTYKQYGITFDERDVYLRGKLLYIMVRGHDTVLQKDFITPKVGNEMVYYNNTYPAILYQLNNKESFERYHLLNFLFASFIFIFLYEVLLYETKKAHFAIIGPLFLAFTPRFFGDIPANPKDIPFAVFYFVSLVTIYFSYKWNSLLRILVLGLSFGIAQATRVVGYSIYPIYIIYLLLEFRNIKKTERRSKIISTIIEILIIFIIGFCIHALSIPYLGVDPFNHFIDLLKNASNFSWNNDVLLWGRTYSAQLKPWFYIPSWFLVTTPLFIYFSLFGFIFLAKTGRLIKLILISIFMNILILIIVRPVVYDGIRHLLYFIPQIALLAAFCFIQLLKSKTHFAKLIVIIIVISLLKVNIDYVTLHPYEYVYFNEIIGGIKGADKKFELDYWGASNKSATEWIKNNIVKDKTNRISLAVCGTSFTSAYYMNTSMMLSDDISNANYAICWDRFDDNKEIRGTLIHSIKREGVPLVGIYKINK